MEPLHILLLGIDNNTELVHIQVTENNEDTNGCTAANHHRRNYQEHTSFTVAREEEHQ
jgi:hypothetical protein